MAQAQTEPKLLLPCLQPFYDAVVPLSWLVVRVAVGWNLLVHGWNKIMIGPTDALLKGYVDLGFTPPALWFWSSTTIETLAGISLILGLFTRVLRRRCCHRAVDHYGRLLGQRFRLAAPWLRIHAALGPAVLRHRAARRRTVLARSQARPGALVAPSQGIFATFGSQAPQTFGGLAFSGPLPLLSGALCRLPSCIPHLRRLNTPHAA